MLPLDNGIMELDENSYTANSTTYLGLGYDNSSNLLTTGDVCESCREYGLLSFLNTDGVCMFCDPTSILDPFRKDTNFPNEPQQNAESSSKVRDETNMQRSIDILTDMDTQVGMLWEELPPDLTIFDATTARPLLDVSIGATPVVVKVSEVDVNVKTNLGKRKRKDREQQAQIPRSFNDDCDRCRRRGRNCGYCDWKEYRCRSCSNVQYSVRCISYKKLKYKRLLKEGGKNQQSSTCNEPGEPTVNITTRYLV